MTFSRPLCEAAEARGAKGGGGESRKQGGGRLGHDGALAEPQHAAIQDRLAVGNPGAVRIIKVPDYDGPVVVAGLDHGLEVVGCAWGDRHGDGEEEVGGAVNGA